MLDNLCISIAWILPKRLVKWAFIRVVAGATTGRYCHTVLPDLNVVEALKRWE